MFLRQTRVRWKIRSFFAESSPILPKVSEDVQCQKFTLEERALTSISLFCCWPWQMKWVRRNSVHLGSHMALKKAEFHWNPCSNRYLHLVTSLTPYVTCISSVTGRRSHSWNWWPLSSRARRSQRGLGSWEWTGYFSFSLWNAAGQQLAGRSACCHGTAWTRGIGGRKW